MSLHVTPFFWIRRNHVGAKNLWKMPIWKIGEKCGEIAAIITTLTSDARCIGLSSLCTHVYLYFGPPATPGKIRIRKKIDTVKKDTPRGYLFFTVSFLSVRYYLWQQRRNKKIKSDTSSVSHSNSNTRHGKKRFSEVFSYEWFAVRYCSQQEEEMMYGIVWCTFLFVAPYIWTRSLW